MATAGNSCVIRIKKKKKATKTLPARQDLVLWLEDVTAPHIDNTSRLDQWGCFDILTHNILLLMLLNLKPDKENLKKTQQTNKQQQKTKTKHNYKSKQQK